MQANPQNDRQSDRQLVERCVTAVCRKAGFPDPTLLVQRDLQFLSEAIETKTGILISLSTMKRLLNRQFSRLPQIATLDALARFLDYDNWQGFIIEQRATAANDKPPAKAAIGSRKGPPVPRRYFNQTRVVLALGLLFLAAFGLIAVIRVHKPGPGNWRVAQFSATKVTRNDLPNTVVFRYNVDSINADSFFIQQSWDSTRRVRVYPKNYTLTDIYYEPGYHNARLIADNRIIKMVPVSIPTDRWFFYSKEKPAGSLPRYITPAKPVKDGALQLTPDDLAANVIDTRQENKYIEVYFPSRIDAGSDNFTFRFRVRMKALANVSCPYIMCEVFCQRHFMYFISGPKGCTSELKAQFGDRLLNGKTYDLSALGTDVRQWQVMELTVLNGEVRIRFNGSEALYTTYHDSCGLITGLGFISNGLCAIDSVDLRTGDGKIVYANDFE